MPILAGDIKLVASQVMSDVPEGGGAPTSTVILDGASNAVFPDISELDRAGGRVNLRKLHVAVQTPDTDVYLGSNVIVAEPPEDPNVSVTLFAASSTFDNRVDAATRIESYLSTGPVWNGYLLEDHIKGQRVIQLLQRVDSELPSVGQTLVLSMNEGQANAVTQYVRTTEVASVVRTLGGVNGGEFQAAVVSCSISDALRFDFAGSPPNSSFYYTAGKTKVRDTVVADAGTYVGVSPLTAAADIGDYTVSAQSTFTQLVPSAQTETPITDVRTNGLGGALVATGGPVVQSLTMGFSTSQNMFVGGPIYPGSLSIERAGVTLVDTGGLLTNAGAEVGQVDYDNGVISLSSNIWGASGGTHTVTFTPATLPDLIWDSRAILVTPESRSLSYVLTMDDIPVARSISVSYLAQGRWYVLRDNGAGVIKGSSSSFGVGTVSYTTGSVSLTLGALPDVGGSIVIQSYSKAATVAATNTLLTNNAKLYFPINTDGLASEEKGSKHITIGSLSVAWSYGGQEKLALDDGLGNLAGDATGTVDYSAGVVRVSPSQLTPPGTVFLIDMERGETLTTPNVSLVNGNLGRTNIIPGSVSFLVNIKQNYALTVTDTGWALDFASSTVPVTVFDLDGILNFRDPGNDNLVAIGVIDYAAGTINLDTTAPAVALVDISAPMVRHSYVGPVSNWVTNSYAWLYAPVAKTRTMAITSTHVTVAYGTEYPGPDAISVTVNQFMARVRMVPNYTLKGVSFTAGGMGYQQLTDGTLVTAMNPLTGGGTPAGSVSGAIGAVFLSNWSAGASPLISNWRGLISPPTVGVQAPFSAFSTIFRTAASPLRPGSLSITGTMQDGTAFNVTSGLDGTIDGARVKGRVNYKYGLVELYFVNPDGSPDLLTNFAPLGIPGLSSMPADLVMLTTLRYNAVSYSYLPLDAAILGIDPVRLPTDGRVPIFRAGGFAVVGHTGRITATVANGQVVNCARVRLSRVRILGSDGNVINTGYTADLEAGLVTFNNTGSYPQPVTIEHRIEDMAVVREAQIDGTLTFTRPLTHHYPVGSFVSSALVSQDLFSRVSVFFDQNTWNGLTWLDSVSGDPATGTYNAVLAPPVVTNIGAVTERWALRFTSTTAFQIIGEHVGVLGTGSINTLTAPINPATNEAYFVIPILGWGLGWAAGNVLRFNTIGAMFPVWVVRTIQQGAESVQDDSFTLLVRGDVDRP